jgi:hypothetical protein
VRHSFRACQEEFGDDIDEGVSELLCDEEGWKKEPAEVKMSKVETEKKHRRDFVSQEGRYFVGWRLSSRHYFTRAEQLFPQDGVGNEDNEDNNGEDWTSTDARSVEGSSSYIEYDTADEGC